MSSNRKSELSLMNVILCFFVIFIHAASSAVTYADRTSLQYAMLFPVWKLASCAVPGFFFLAGLKLSLGLDRPFSYLKYLSGRIWRVIIPYTVAAAIFAIYQNLKGYTAFTPVGFLTSLIDGSICAHFYFVITIVQFYLMAPVWRALTKRLDSGVRVAATLIISYFLMLIFGQYLADFLILFDNTHIFMYCDRVFTTYLFWWVAGLAAGRYYEAVRAEASRSFILSLSIFLPAAVLDGWLAYIHNAKNAGIWWLETAHTFYVLTAIIFIFSLCTKLSESKLVSVAAPIDKVSYQIYLFHPLFLYFADSICLTFGIGSISAVFTVRLVFGYAVTIGLCILLNHIMQFIRAKVR